MKSTSTFLLLLLSLTAFSQQTAMVINRGDEPSALYREVNESLTAGNTKLAINIFEKVIAFYEGEGRMQELSENYLGMALSFAFSGHYDESIRYHKKALKAHRKYRPSESPDAIMINLGLTYQLAGKEKKAKKYLN